MNESNYRTVDGRKHEVKTCPGCGRRAAIVRDASGKVLEKKGYS